MPSTTSAAAGKALKASKAARVGVTKKKTVVRTKVHFYRPKTKLGGVKEKSYLRTLPKARKTKKDEYHIVKQPLTSEAAMKKIEDHNTLVFLVDPRSTKKQISAAVKKVCLSPQPLPPPHSHTSLPPPFLFFYFSNACVLIIP